VVAASRWSVAGQGRTGTGGAPLNDGHRGTRGLHPAVKKAGLDQPDKPRLRFHDLRHTYASLLIAQGLNVTFVLRQLGHASITTTLNVYTLWGA
jgi:integrase